MDWASFLPPFFGVLVAFAINRVYGYIKDMIDKKKLLRSFKTELETSLGFLDGHGNILPVTIWNSAMTSGKLMLLSYNQIIQISSIYFSIENQNYEAKRTRDIAEMYETEGHPTARETVKQHWQRLTLRLNTLENILRNDINELLKQNIWDC
jgi:hypothetical protein